MTRHSIEVTFAIDDKPSEYGIINPEEAEDELMEALDDLPPTVGISHVENHGENVENVSPENMSDDQLAEEFKSYYLQMENDLPRTNSAFHRYLALRKEIADRDNLEVLDSVRVVSDDEEVLAE